LHGRKNSGKANALITPYKSAESQGKVRTGIDELRWLGQKRRGLKKNKEGLTKLDGGGARAVTRQGDQKGGAYQTPVFPS